MNLSSYLDQSYIFVLVPVAIYVLATILGVWVRSWKVPQLEAHYHAMFEKKAEEFKKIGNISKLEMVRYITISNLIYTVLITFSAMALIFPGLCWLAYNRFTIGYVAYARYSEKMLIKVFLDVLEAPIVLLGATIGTLIGREEWKWIMGASWSIEVIDIFKAAVPLIIIALLLLMAGGIFEGMIFIPSIKKAKSGGIDE